MLELAGLLGFFQQRASPLRQALDLFDFVLTLAFVYVVFGVMAPFQGQLRSGEVAVDKESFEKLHFLNVTLLVMNLIGLAVVIIRYNETGTAALAKPSSKKDH